LLRIPAFTSAAPQDADTLIALVGGGGKRAA
jgi:hypothetical protein